MDEILFCLALAKRHSWRGYIRMLEGIQGQLEREQQRRAQESEAKSRALEMLQALGATEGSDVWYDTGYEVLKTRVVRWPTDSWDYVVLLQMPDPPKRVHSGDPRRIYLELPSDMAPGKYCRYCRQDRHPCGFHKDQPRS
jgi:hypothetical protein